MLQRIAEGLHLEGISQAKMPSSERRLARFVANRRIQVLPIWRTFLEHVLPQWHGQAVRLVLDMTPCGEHATIVYLGLLVHSRVLPLMWRVMPLHEEWDQGQVSRSRLEWVAISQVMSRSPLALRLAHREGTHLSALDGQERDELDSVRARGSQSRSAPVRRRPASSRKTRSTPT